MRPNSSIEQFEQSSNGGYPHNGGGNPITRGGPMPPTSVNPIGLSGIRQPSQPPESFGISRSHGQLAPSAAAQPAGPIQSPVQLGQPVQPRPIQPVNPAPNDLTKSPLERGGGFGGIRPLMQY